MPIRNADLERVRALPLFADVSDEAFRDVIAGAFLQRFPAGTTLLTEGDPVDFLYVLLDGSVELGGAWNDKETTLAVLRPVSTFVLAAVVLDAECLMSAQAIERSDVLMLSGEALRRTMRRDSQLCFSVSQDLAGSHRGMVRALKNQKLRGGIERVANYLIAQQVRQGGGETITLPHDKRALASLLGMTPENLSRAFAALTDYGVVVKGPRVSLTRPAVVGRLAKPDPLIDNPLGMSQAVGGEAARERSLSPPMVAAHGRR